MTCYTKGLAISESRVIVSYHPQGGAGCWRGIVVAHLEGPRASGGAQNTKMAFIDHPTSRDGFMDTDKANS